LISAKKLDIDATSYRRSGGKVAAAVNKEQNFSKESNHYITNFIRQQQFLRKQLQLLANVRYLQLCLLIRTSEGD
jgi:hypothetical protein